jgi:NDP-sugar pyrophosphorylase family protein
VIIYNDGALSNDTRLGAVADIEIAIGLVDADYYVVVAGDTLLSQSVDVKALLNTFVQANDCDALTVGYRMRQPHIECKSRGLLVRGDDGTVIRFVEKPHTPPPEPVLASAPL